MIGLRVAVAVGLLAIAAWVVAWRRARPDLCPFWLAAKLVALLVSISGAGLAAAVGSRTYTAAVALVALVANVVAVRLWRTRGWLARRQRGAEGHALEARRLADAALDEVAAAEREEGRRE